MLNIMTHYLSAMTADGKSQLYLSEISAIISLLKVTSILIRVFRDDRPIKIGTDKRLEELKYALQWFVDWQSSIKNKPEFITVETMEDLKSLITGFTHLCEMRITKGEMVVPSRINSDIVENIFCQQRTITGANTNPSLCQYKSGLASIILGQTSVSKKSNACPLKRGAQAFNFTHNVSFRKKSK